MAAASQFLRLSPNEIAMFDRLFSLVEDPGTGIATGAQVSGLFLTSGLPRPILATIWNIASAGKGGKLDKDGFFIGCRLVALAQQNLPVSQESLLAHREVPPPFFQGVQQYYSREQRQTPYPPQVGVQPSSQMNSTMPSVMTGSTPGSSSLQPGQANSAILGPAPGSSVATAMPSTLQPMPALTVGSGQNQPSSQITMQPSSQMLSTAQQTRVVSPMPVLVQQSVPGNDYSIPSASSAMDPARTTNQNQPPMLPSAAASRRTSVQTDSLWDISPEKRETYLKYFDQADADKDGFVNGKEAKTFFTMSKLSSAVLRDIWLLSDIDQDNRLNKEEFTIAMHLTMAVRMSGVPVPAQLPDPLMQYYNRQMQQLQSSANVTFANVATGPGPSSIPAVLSMAAQPNSTFNATSVVTPQPVPAAERSSEKADFVRQISSAKAQIDEQKIAIQGYQSRLPNYEEELQNLKTEAKIAEETLLSLTAERKQHQAAFEKIRADIADAKSNLDSITEKINEERKHINEYQEKVTLGTRQLEELRHERDQLQKSVDDLKHQVQDKELAIVCLEQEMEDIRKQIAHINEVSSYQLQILSKVNNDYEDREKQLSELLTSKAQLDRFKASTSTAAATSSLSAPISPVKPASAAAEPVWTAPLLSGTPSFSAASSAIVQEEFTFPEFNDDDFSNSPLRSAPVTGSSIPNMDLGKSSNSVSNENPVSSVAAADSSKFSSDATAFQGGFPLGTDTAPNMVWDAQPKVTESASSKGFEMNPFEEDDWDIPVKPTSASSSGSAKLQSASSQTHNPDSLSWPPSNFGAQGAAAGSVNWAQF